MGLGPKPGVVSSGNHPIERSCKFCVTWERARSTIILHTPGKPVAPTRINKLNRKQGTSGDGTADEVSLFLS